VAGQQQPEQDRGDLLLPQRPAVPVRRVHQVGGEVVPRRRTAVVGERLAVLPEVGHAGGDAHLLVVVGAAEHEQRPVLGAALPRLDVGGRDPEHLEESG
jgi:hypothetical protein